MPRPAQFCPRVTRLEDRTTPADITFDGTTAFVELNATGEVVTFSAPPGDIEVASTGGVSVNGSEVSTPYYLPRTVTAVIVTDTAAGTGVIFDPNAFTTFDTGPTNFPAAFTVTLNNTPGDVTFFGTSAFGDNPLSVTTSYRISVFGSITNAGGSVFLSANQQAVPTGGFFTGIEVEGEVSSVTGAVTLLGRGGNDPDGVQYGVLLDSDEGGTGFVSGAAVTVTGTGGESSGSSNVGVYLVRNTVITSAAGGPVSVTGTGGGSGVTGGGNNVGVLVDLGTITSGDGGSVSVTGTGGAGDGGNHGVRVTGVDSFLDEVLGLIIFTGEITSGGGAVTVTGTGGNSGGFNVGVLADGGAIHAGGDGATAVSGTGGAGGGDANHGVALFSRLSLSEGELALGHIGSGGSGPVAVSGVGGGSGSSSGNVGVRVGTGGYISNGGSGAVAVTGTGGAGGGTANVGVLVIDADSVISSGGPLDVTGTGGNGTGGLGVSVTDAGAISSLAVTTVTGFGGGGAFGMNVATDGAMTVSGTAPLALTADSIAFDPTAVITGGGTVTLRPVTAGMPLDLGGADVLGGSLGLTDAELDRVTAVTLVLGRDTAGPLTVSANVARPTATGVQLVSGADINTNGTVATFDTGGGTLLLAPGTDAGEGYAPISNGTHAAASVLSFAPGTDVKFLLLKNSQQTVLGVNGTIDLTGADLVFALSSEVYNPGDTVTIVTAAAVTGTFNGVPNGGVVLFENRTWFHVYYSATDVILVANSAPTGVSAGGPYTVAEGSGLTFTATAADPDGDTLSYTWDVNGDGTFGDEEGGTISDGGRTVAFTGPQLAALGLGDGPRVGNVAVEVTDDLSTGANPSAVTATSSLTITNVAPTISVSGAASVNEGSPYTLTLGAITDPGQETVTAFRVFWGDGTNDTFTTAGPKTHTYTDDGTYTITVDLTDEDGTFPNAGNPFSVVVNNVAPTITGFTVPAGGRVGRPVASTATASDPGAVDALTFTWTATLGGVVVASGSGAAFTFTPDAPGDYTVALTVTDADGGTASASAAVQVLPVFASVPVAAGNAGRVRVTYPDGRTRDFEPFRGFLGDVTVAKADLTGDGIPEVVVGAGQGGGPHVKVFDGNTGAEVASFFAYAQAFTGGIFVAASDDGRIVTGAGAFGGPHVKVFNLSGVMQGEFFAYDAGFIGGVRVAMGDVTGDGVDDLVTGAGPGGGAHVKAFDGGTLAEVASFFAFIPGFAGGVYVSVSSNGLIAAGAGTFGGPHVQVFNASGRVVAETFVYDFSFVGGVRVGFGDVDADGADELLVAPGLGATQPVRALRMPDFAEVRSLAPFRPLDPLGVFVG